MTKLYCKVANQNAGIFNLPNLPYERNALEPYYSEKLFNLHHGKHHAAYVTNLNNLIKDSKYVDMDLESIIQETKSDAATVGFFNNAAQIWNHTFFWYSMKANGGGKPTGELLAKIEADFGGFDKFKDEFTTKATKIFGSGWCWLVVDTDKKLKIVTTSNAATPITDGLRPILTIDVWEHAYYPDYENRRAEFIEKFLNHLANWEFAAECYSSH